MNIENINFESIIKRIKGVKNLRDDQEVAALLGMSKGAFSERKRRGSIPRKELEILCERESINLDWLLTGEGPMKKYEVPEEKGLTVSEPSAIYNEREDPEMDEIVSILRHDLPGAKKYILKILKGTLEAQKGVEGMDLIKKTLKEEG